MEKSARAFLQQQVVHAEAFLAASPGSSGKAVGFFPSTTAHHSSPFLLPSLPQLPLKKMTTPWGGMVVGVVAEFGRG